MTDPDLIQRNIANRPKEKALQAVKRASRQRAQRRAALEEQRALIKETEARRSPAKAPEPPPTALLAHELRLLGVVAKVRIGPLVYTSWDRGVSWRAATQDGYLTAVDAANAGGLVGADADAVQAMRRRKFTGMTAPAKLPKKVVIPEGLFP